MSTVLELEEFSSHSINAIENFSLDTDTAIVQNQVAPDNASFERGYKAGWDDASVAEEQNQNRISADFARNIQDLGFTYHEARNHVIKSLENLLTELFEKILPDIASDYLGLTIVEEIVPMAKLVSDVPVEIVVSPAARQTLETLLEEIATVQFEIVEETSLSSGQVFLRAGKIERQIDFSHILKTASSALTAVYQVNERALKHG